MRRPLTALVAGLVFGAGLVLSGMTDPRNVVAFLDVTGGFGPWSPNLAAVMVGAIAVHFTALRVLGARRPQIHPAGEGGAPFDARLVGGAAIFGVGWGLAGYCPGPAIVTLGSGTRSAWAFVLAMVVGVLLGEAAARRGVRPARAARNAPAC
jgi:uncharacterized membrane protein YedE/YeeE